jgi:hypothetical protein
LKISTYEFREHNSPHGIVIAHRRKKGKYMQNVDENKMQNIGRKSR